MTEALISSCVRSAGSFKSQKQLDVRKFFLDIDKVQKYPITFVIKSEMPIPELTKKMREQAKEAYGIEKIADRYMECVEEIINIPILLERFNAVIKESKLGMC